MIFWIYRKARALLYIFKTPGVCKKAYRRIYKSVDLAEGGGYAIEKYKISIFCNKSTSKPSGSPYKKAIVIYFCPYYRNVLNTDKTDPEA